MHSTNSFHLCSFRDVVKGTAKLKVSTSPSPAAANESDNAADKDPAAAKSSHKESSSETASSSSSQQQHSVVVNQSAVPPAKYVLDWDDTGRAWTLSFERYLNQNQQGFC
jgi:hypothetical protein